MERKFNCSLDLDSFVQQYKSFEQTFMSQRKEAGQLQEENQHLKSQIDISTKDCNQCFDDIQANQRLIKSLQESLSQRCNSEDKTRQLQEEIEELKRKDLNQKTEFEQKTCNHQKELQTLAARHEKKQADLRKELLDRAEKEMKEWSRVTEAQEQTIEKLKRKNSRTEKDIEALKKQHEHALQELQDQVAAAQRAGVDKGMQERDLYRKKLQQARCDAQKEISELRGHITSLQQQLAFYEKPSKPKAGRPVKFTNRH